MTKAILHRDGSIGCSKHGLSVVQGELPKERCIACDLEQQIKNLEESLRFVREQYDEQSKEHANTLATLNRLRAMNGLA